MILIYFFNFGEEYILLAFIFNKHLYKIFNCVIVILRFPDTNGRNGWELVPGEVERIVQYQQKGDVATYEELKCYLGWLWDRPCMQAATVR